MFDIPPDPLLEKRKLMLGIVFNTFDYYAQNPFIRRAKMNPSGKETGMGCFYQCPAPDGAKCSIGRLMHEEMLRAIVEEGRHLGARLSSLLRSHVVHETYNRIGCFFGAVDGMDDLSFAFYLKLQKIHDMDILWDGEKCELTMQGHIERHHFIAAIESGGFDVADHRPSIKYIIENGHEHDNEILREWVENCDTH